jgi:uncharacterized protein YpmB
MAKLNKTTIETIKTVVISVLITAIVAFVGGVMYANQTNNDKAAAVNAASAQVTAATTDTVKK